LKASEAYHEEALRLGLITKAINAAAKKKAVIKKKVAPKPKAPVLAPAEALALAAAKQAKEASRSHKAIAPVRPDTAYYVILHIVDPRFLSHMEPRRSRRRKRLALTKPRPRYGGSG